MTVGLVMTKPVDLKQQKTTPTTVLAVGVYCNHKSKNHIRLKLVWHYAQHYEVAVAVVNYAVAVTLWAVVTFTLF